LLCTGQVNATPLIFPLRSSQSLLYAQADRASGDEASPKPIWSVGAVRRDAGQHVPGRVVDGKICLGGPADGLPIDDGVEQRIIGLRHLRQPGAVRLDVCHRGAADCALCLSKSQQPERNAPRARTRQVPRCRFRDHKRLLGPTAFKITAQTIKPRSIVSLDKRKSLLHTTQQALVLPLALPLDATADSDPQPIDGFVA
jgi:hypothetical protein